MASWTDGLMLGLDTETTGQDPNTAHLVTATAAICPPCPPGQAEQASTVEWLADPGIEIPEGAAEVHGITTEHAREHGRPEGDVIAEILAWLAEHWTRTDPLVIYNAAYDLTLIDRRGRAHGLIGPEGIKIRGPIVDPLIMDRMHPSTRFRRTAHEGGRTLTNVSRFYGCPMAEGSAHEATADCLAAIAVARAAGRRHRNLGRMDLRTLYVWQRKAARQWGTEMSAFILRKAEEEAEANETELTPEERADTVREGDWPTRPYDPDTATREAS